MPLSAKIEAVLFFRNEPVSVSELSRICEAEEEKVTAALSELAAALSGRGITLVVSNNEAVLGTAPEASDLITRLRRDELSRDLGKAGAETLSIVLYEGPVSRSDIDFIRGVNSSFIIRNLLVRGLIERTEEKGRGTRYQATPALLAHLGIGTVAALPEYEKIRMDITAFRTGAAANADPTE